MCYADPGPRCPKHIRDDRVKFLENREEARKKGKEKRVAFYDKKLEKLKKDYIFTTENIQNLRDRGDNERADKVQAVRDKMREESNRLAALRKAKRDAEKAEMEADETKSAPADTKKAPAKKAPTKKPVAKKPARDKNAYPTREELMNDGLNRDAEGYPQPEPGTHPSAKETAAVVRKDLKSRFPGTKFSVRMSTGTGYGWLHVDYTDGPPKREVDMSLGHYQYEQFNGMTDNYDATGSPWGLSGVIVQKSYSDDRVEAMRAKVETDDMGNMYVDHNGMRTFGRGYNHDYTIARQACEREDIKEYARKTKNKEMLERSDTQMWFY